MLLVEPVVIRPLLVEWEAEKTVIAARWPPAPRLDRCYATGMSDDAQTPETRAPGTNSGSDTKAIIRSIIGIGLSTLLSTRHRRNALTRAQGPPGSGSCRWIGGGLGREPMSAESTERELKTSEKAILGGLSSILVLLARALTFNSNRRFEGTDGFLLMAVLIVLWLICLFVLVGMRERDRFCLVMKGIGLPGALLAGGEFVGL